MADTVNLAPVINAIRVVQQQQVQLQGQVGDLASAHRETRNELAQLATTVNEYIEEYRRLTQFQLAREEIVAVVQELDRSFRHHDELRNAATGLLQAFDSGLITASTVQGVTEEMMIKAPRYWLGPVLVALAAWSRNERALAERAMAEALRRDVDKTSLFFMLVMRRYRRETASCRWLEQYLCRQDPTELGREFVVILEAVANGAFGVGAKTVTAASVDAWLVELAHNEGFVEDQVKRWLQEMRRMIVVEPKTSYPTLAAWSPSWGDIAINLGMVKAHLTIGKHFYTIFAGALVAPPDIEHRVDDLLENLVRSFDEEELPLRRRQAELQAIIDAEGDRTAASKAAEATRSALEETISFPNLLTNAAMHPKEAAVTKGTQRLAVALSKKWICEAHSRFTAEARAGLIMDVPITFETWSTTLRSGGDEAQLRADVVRHIEQETEASVARVKFTGAPLISAIVAVLLLLIGIPTWNPLLLVLAVAAAVYAGWGYKHLDTVRMRIRADGERRQEQAVDGVKNVCAELVDLRRTWQKEDDRARSVYEFLVNLNPAEHSLAAPGSRREVVR